MTDFDFYTEYQLKMKEVNMVGDWRSDIAGILSDEALQYMIKADTHWSPIFKRIINQELNRRAIEDILLGE